MTLDSNPLMAEIRKWLQSHPLTDDGSLDVHGVPVSLFDLTDTDERLKHLNRQIKGLPLQQQKLLLYLSRDIEPALIIESMEYPSPELFWLDKALLVKEVDPTARQQEVLQVFDVNQKLVDEIYRVSDIMDHEEEKSKSRKYRRWSLIAAPVILVLLVLVIYPLLIKPDTGALYDQFKSVYKVDLNSIDTTSYNGGSFYEAVLLMDQGDFAASAKLFEELIPTDSNYRATSRWFLALINLHNGDVESCQEQLKALRVDDPSFYKRVAEKLSGKL
jgi:hypothetical protein